MPNIVPITFYMFKVQMSDADLGVKIRYILKIPIIKALQNAKKNVIN